MRILFPLILAIAIGLPLGPPNKVTPPDTTYIRGYTWSPDSTKIAYNSAGFLKVSNSDGTDLRTLSATEDLLYYDPMDPAWSPDGSRIAFVSGGGPHYSIYVINADGTGLTNISGLPYADFPTYVYDKDPEWSSDSSKIFFSASNPEGYMRIYVMDADGKNRTQLSTGVFDNSPTLSPDGRKIAFVQPVAGDEEIFVMNIDGTNQIRLTNNPVGPDFDPAWSPDGSKLAFVTSRDYAGTYIYVMNADGSSQESLVPFTEGAVERYPTWSRDGSTIAYVSRNYFAGLPNLYIINVKNSYRTKLTDDIVDNAALWSPDGSKLLFEHAGLNTFSFYFPDFGE